MSEHRAAPRWMILVLAAVWEAISFSTVTATAAVPQGSATAKVAAGRTLPLEALGVVPRHRIWWPFRTGPVYAEPATADHPAADAIALPVGTFHAGQRLDIPAELTNTTDALAQGGAQYFLVTLRAGASDARALASIAPVVGEVPVNTLVMRLDQAADERVRSSPEVALVEPYHAAYKINPDIGSVPQASQELADSPNFNLSVLLFKGERFEPVVGALRASGITPGSLVDVGEDQFQLELRQVAAMVIAASTMSSIRIR